MNELEKDVVSEKSHCDLKSVDLVEKPLRKTKEEPLVYEKLVWQNKSLMQYQKVRKLVAREFYGNEKSKFDS